MQRAIQAEFQTLYYILICDSTKLKHIYDQSYYELLDCMMFRICSLIRHDSESRSWCVFALDYQT